MQTTEKVYLAWTQKTESCRVIYYCLTPYWVTPSHTSITGPRERCNTPEHRTIKGLFPWWLPPGPIRRNGSTDIHRENPQGLHGYHQCFYSYINHHWSPSLVYQWPSINRSYIDASTRISIIIDCILMPSINTMWSSFPIKQDWSEEA